MKFILLGLIIYLLYSLIPTLICKHKWKDGFKLEEGKKQIMLTFDDGPDPKYTEELLDLLEKENIRASFFLVGDYIGYNKLLVKRMVKEGHSIGLHSKDHSSNMLKGFFLTWKNFKESFDELKKIGYSTDYYRPPWGQVNLFTFLFLKLYKKKMILWNLMVGDWEKDVESEEIEERILKELKPGSIICLHDGRSRTDQAGRMIKALERLIPRLKKEGYEFITIGDYFEK